MRTTKQKKIIINYLKNVKTHPDAEEVYKEVKKLLPKISLGTVYRNLELFAKQGKIAVLPGKIKRFDGDTGPHHHFVCNSCHQIFDIYQKFPGFDKKIKEKFIGDINKTTITFYGTCQKCKNK